MISALNTLASALPAISAYTANTAHNIVNVETEGFKKTQGSFVSNNLGGSIAFKAQEVNEGVNLSEEVVNLKQAEINYKAVAKALASIDETERRVLNTFG
ncbi:hypothetical protein [Terasakiella pusilla]|uniref:hypothetical protein n=1 Tax=Terasakiella pusilla TaxID=64973 RepID=UPI003AA9527C